MSEPDYKQFGGKLVAQGDNGGYWDFGWIPPQRRSDVQAGAADSATRAMPSFAIYGTRRDDPKKVCLFDVWRHPQVVAANGFEFTGVHQLTGSCVGAGGGNCWMTLAGIEVVRLRDPEQALVPFWLLPYGRSRYYLGDRGPGEGSTGSTFAKAAREDGVVPAVSPGLPPFTRDDGFVWGSRVEMHWSDGDNPDTMKLLPESRKHLVKTTAQCRNGDDVRQAIVNGYPCTCASMYAHRPSVESDPPVLLGRKSGSWSHQMSLLAWWEHPKLGEIFWLHNQWGLNAHGRDPAGGPPGGVWITKSDVDWICRGEEVFAFSQFAGFPVQDLSWYF